MRLSHNIPALQAHHSMLQASAKISTASARLSSGTVLNRAKDNPSGMAISNRMRAQINGLETANTNAMDGISIVQTADGALNEIHSMIQRMRELAIQAATDTVEDDDREKIQMEIDQLVQEINDVSYKAQFNTKKLFGNKYSASTLSSIFDAAGNITGAVRITSKDIDFPSGDIDFDITSAGQYASHTFSFTSDAFPLGADAVLTVDGITINLKAGDDWNSAYSKIKTTLENNGMIVMNNTGHEVTVYAKNEIDSITLDIEDIITSQPNGAMQINVDISDLFANPASTLSTDVALQIGDLTITLTAGMNMTAAMNFIKQELETAGMAVANQNFGTGEFSILTTDESITDATFRIRAMSVANPGAATHTVNFDSGLFNTAAPNNLLADLRLTIGDYTLDFYAGTHNMANIIADVTALLSANYPGAQIVTTANGFEITANGLGAITSAFTGTLPNLSSTSQPKQGYQIDLSGVTLPPAAVGDAVITIGGTPVDLLGCNNANDVRLALLGATYTPPINLDVTVDSAGRLAIYADPGELGTVSCTGGGTAAAFVSSNEYDLTFAPLPTTTPMVINLGVYGSVQVPPGAQIADITAAIQARLGDQCVVGDNGTNVVTIVANREISYFTRGVWRGAVTVNTDTSMNGREITINSTLPLSYDLEISVGGYVITIDSTFSNWASIAAHIQSEINSNLGITVSVTANGNTLSMFSNDTIPPITHTVAADIMQASPNDQILGYDIDFTKTATPLGSDVELTIAINNPPINTIITVTLPAGSDFNTPPNTIQSIIQARIDGVMGTNNYTVGYTGEGKITIYPAPGSAPVLDVTYVAEDLLDYPGYTLQFDEAFFNAGLAAGQTLNIDFADGTTLTFTITATTWAAFLAELQSEIDTHHGAPGSTTVLDQGNGKISFTNTVSDIVDATTPSLTMNMTGTKGSPTTLYTPPTVSDPIIYTDMDGNVHNLVLGTDYFIIDGKIVLTYDDKTIELEIPIYYDENYYALGNGQFVLGDANKTNGTKGTDITTVTNYAINIQLRSQDYGQFIVQIGANKDERMDIEMPEVNAAVLGLENIEYVFRQDAEDAIDSCDAAISMISAFRATLGSYQNRLEYTVTGLDTMAITMQDALSRLADTDMAKEMSTYTQQSVIYQAAMSVLAQANQRPQQILQLLGR